MPTRITICCAEDSVFGGDTAGYDVTASLHRYAALTTAAVQAVYPDAAIDTTFEPQMWGVQVATTDDDDDAIRDAVADICSRVHQDGAWAIAIQKVAS